MTKRQAIQELKALDPAAAEALRHIDTRKKTIFCNKPSNCTSLAAYISCAFTWGHTPQGYAYWDNVWSHLLP